MIDLRRPVSRLLLVMMTVALIAPLMPVRSAVAAVASADSPAGAATWERTWSDEFDGPDGAAPDTTKWGYDIGAFRGEERQAYTSGRENSRLDGNGNLIIEARRENTDTACGNEKCTYTSARLITNQKFAQQYGRLTARIKVPAAGGSWPAFWALSEDMGIGKWPDTGELDVVDNFGKPHQVDGGPIGPKPSSCTMPGAGGAYFAGSHFDMPSSAPLSGGYHVFSMDWYPDHVSNWVDGRMYSIVYKADVLANGCSWPFDRKFWLLLNVAVGGQAGQPVEAAFPARMLVDYVRVDRSVPPTTPATGPIVGRGAKNRGKCVDNSYGSTADLNPVKQTVCKGNLAQQWTVLTDGTIQVQDKCLDVRDSGTWVNALVQIHTCVAGAPSQYWRIESNGTIVNRQAELCLTSAGDEQRLTLQACTAQITAPAPDKTSGPDESSQLWAVPAPPSTTGHWPLNEQSGDTAADATNADRTLTCTGNAAWVPDSSGIGLDGGNGSCQSVAPAADTTGPYSVSAWVWPNTELSGVNRTVVSQDGAHASGFYLQYNAQFQQWAMSLPLSDAELPQFGLARGGPVEARKWTLLTATVDPAARRVVLYVDGVEAGTATIVANASGIAWPWPARGAVTVGRGQWEGRPSDFFPGTVADVRTYNYALSATEVSALLPAQA